jgi:hypothetical protein
MNTNNLKQWILESIYSRLTEQGDDDSNTKSSDKTVKGRGVSGSARKSRRTRPPNPETLQAQASARKAASEKPTSSSERQFNAEAAKEIQKDTEKEDYHIKKEQGDTGASEAEVKKNIEAARAEKVKKGNGKKRAKTRGNTKTGEHSAESLEVTKARIKRDAKRASTFSQNPPAPSHDSGVPHRKGIDKDSDQPKKHFFKNPEGGETKRAVAINRLTRRGYIKRDDRGHLVYGDKHPAAGQTVRGKLGHFFKTGSMPRSKKSTHPDVKPSKPSKGKKPKLGQSEHGTRDPKFLEKEKAKEKKITGTFKF